MQGTRMIGYILAGILGSGVGAGITMWIYGRVLDKKLDELALQEQELHADRQLLDTIHRDSWAFRRKWEQ